jgi:hypothetical protein
VPLSAPPSVRSSESPRFTSVIARLPRLVTAALTALRHAWTSPRTPTWAVLFAAFVFAIRKPWALLTPQLYAEDGSIFLVQQDLFGARALLEPYMGYLHTLPRLIASLAANLTDPAWWPAVYNGSAYALTVALFFRIASPRLAVPGKPALLLAFTLIAHTGEVTINVTNVQWIAAFFLVLQPLLSAPTSALSRATDLTLTAVVGLTGPFSIILLPLFAWRWWSDTSSPRLKLSSANVQLLALTSICAAVQAWFLLHQPAEPTASAPLRILPLLSVLGSRLLVWSFFGPSAVALVPDAARIVLACTFLSALAVWALRPHALRPTRLTLLLTFAVLLIACMARVRPDTWERDDLFNGDRYFYLPRLLLVWLLILEFTTPRRAIAWTARALVVVGFTVHLPMFVSPAPPNYHWADHCDPLRRGTPANIKTLPAGWWIEYPGRPNRK